ncbi:MAG: anaerobic ribonucleoside-triphosphate reductase activating protein [Candidatus Bipolaricaulota bacterium]
MRVVILEIAAVQWTSLQDFPDRVAAVVWTPGCNLRCPFCYNAELVLPEPQARSTHVPPGKVLRTLRERAGFLEGVVLTGGEPTLQPALLDFLYEVKRTGLAVKLDTNGTRPSVLDRLLQAGLVDYVAVDVKAPPEKYARFARPPETSEEDVLAAVKRSLTLLRENSVDHEARTTVAPGLDKEDLGKIARWIAPAQRYFLQPFACPPESRLVDQSLRHRAALTPDRLREVAASLSSLLPTYVRA